MAGQWECHVESDWLLVYLANEAEVILVCTDSHEDLFG
jgi:mRNA interferase YafQ